jgi:putative ABC transport system ATP-binding protein
MKGKDKSTPIVRLKDVVKTYKLGETTVPALRGCSLTLNRGDFTALIGASGSGKSTVLNMVGCIDEPDSGSIEIDNVNIKPLSDLARSRLRNEKIGFIFQSFNLIPVLTAYENVELPLLINQNVNPAEYRERVQGALADVDLSGFAHHLPDQLSGGQRQRVAIARALAAKPALILADEPTANLDSVNSTKIIDLMIELNRTKGVTFLFSTHDERLMDRVSHIVHIRDGIIHGVTAGER